MRLFLVMACWGIAWGQSLPTVTVLSANAATTGSGQTVVAIATINSSSPIAGGSVDFSVDGLFVRNVPIQESQTAGTQAVLRLPLATGVHHLSAAFRGYEDFKSSTSSDSIVSVGGVYKAEITIEGQPGTLGAIHYTLASDSPDLPPGQLNLVSADDGTNFESVAIATGPALKTGFRTETIPGGLQPGVFASGDFDGNGYEDLAIVDPSGKRIEIMLWDPSRSGFRQGKAVSLSGSATAIVAADLNGDGLCDIAVIDAGSGLLTIFLGDPDHRGEFVSFGQGLQLMAGVSSMLAIDINKDGLPDLLVTNALQNTLSVLLGKPEDPGQFRAAQQLSTNGVPSAMASGDFFGLGSVDLAVTSYQDGSVSLFENDPASPGTFIAQTSVQKVGAGPSAIQVGDFNGDGVPDLAVCNSLDDTVSILLGNPGRRGQYPTQNLIKVGSSPGAIALSPLNAGRNDDLLVGNYDDGSLEILENGGSGTFSKSEIIYSGESIKSVAFLDGSAFGVPRIVATDPDGGVLRIVQRSWSLAGDFPANSLIKPSKTRVRATFDTPWSDAFVSVSSNVLEIGTGTKNLPSQIISFVLPAHTGYGIPLDLQASASSGLPVALKVTAGPALLVNGRLTPTDVGLVTIAAVQGGNAQYAPAEAVNRTMAVDPAPLTAEASPATQTVGQPMPQLAGKLKGVVNGDAITVTFTSEVSASTSPGVYVTTPFAVTPSLADPQGRLKNYVVTATSAPFTVLPLARTPPTPVLPSPLPAPPLPTPAPPPMPVTPVLPISPVPVPLPSPPLPSPPLPSPLPPSPPLPVSPLPSPPFPSPIRGGEPPTRPNPPVMPVPIPITKGTPTLPWLPTFPSLPGFLHLSTPHVLVLPLILPLPRFHLGGRKPEPEPRGFQMNLRRVSADDEKDLILELDVTKGCTPRPHGSLIMFDSGEELMRISTTTERAYLFAIPHIENGPHIFSVDCLASSNDLMARSNPIYLLVDPARDATVREQSSDKAAVQSGTYDVISDEKSLTSISDLPTTKNLNALSYLKSQFWPDFLLELADAPSFPRTSHPPKFLASVFIEALQRKHLTHTRVHRRHHPLLPARTSRASRTSRQRHSHSIPLAKSRKRSSRRVSKG